MTDLQKVEWNILKEFVRVCDQLQLTYFMVCGTALGSAKYKGFIPWDDDVDVALPRPDYEIFCEKAQALLPEHLFLQNSKTDPNYPLIFSKIRDSGTTYVEKPYASTDMHHGIYIDVFPLDGYPKDKKSQERLEKEKKSYLLKRLCCLSIPRTWKTGLLVAGLKLLRVHKHPSRLVSRLEAQISRYPTEDSEIWCNHGNWQGKLEYAPREQYGQGTWAEFEGLPVRIPEKIDTYLTQKYGDWRSDPPESEMVGHHYHYICDTERPYTDYIVKASKGNVWFKI